jgi:hypothetical protein
MTPDLLTEVRAIHRELVAIRKRLDEVVAQPAATMRADVLASIPTIERSIRTVVRSRPAHGSDE